MISTKQLLKVQNNLQLSYDDIHTFTEWEQMSIGITSSNVKILIDAIDELLVLRDLLVEKALNNDG